MVIRSKFEIGEYVWFLNPEGKYQIGKILGITGWTDYGKFQYDVESRDRKNHLRHEGELYRTKEEVLENVFTKCEYDMETGW